MTGDRRLLGLGVVTFVAACAALFVGFAVLGTPVHPEPGRTVAEVASIDADGLSVVVLDARDSAAWRGFSFALGRVVPDGPAADVLVQRYLIKAPRGAVDLGDVPIATATVGDAPDWAPDAMRRWYDYGYLSHVLHPKGHVYAVNTDDGVVYAQVDGYYCAPEGGGCMALRYRLAPATSPASVRKNASTGP